jgi:hypothetical protein
VGNYTLYFDRVFDIRFVETQRRDDPNEPNPLQPERAEMLYNLLHRLNAGQLASQEDKIVTDALNAGRRVFVVSLRAQFDATRYRYFPPSRFVARTLMTWSETSDDRPRTPANAQRPLAARKAQIERVQPNQLWELIEISQVKPTAPPNLIHKTTARIGQNS